MANFFKALMSSFSSDDDNKTVSGATGDATPEAEPTQTPAAAPVVEPVTTPEPDAAAPVAPATDGDAMTAEPEPVIVDVEPSDDSAAPATTPLTAPAATPVADSTTPSDDITAPVVDTPSSDTPTSDTSTSDTPATAPDVPEPVVAPAAGEPAEEVKPDLDAPAVRLKTSVNLASEEGYVVGISIQGRGHIMSGTPCQDYHAFEDLGDGWLLAITSDGAGSAREAERGSKANCEMATKMIKKLIADRGWKSAASLPSDKEWYIEVKNDFDLMQARIKKHDAAQAADYKPTTEENRPLEPRDFNATIIVLLITPLGMMAAHIGDGRMGYLSQDGEWKTLMTPHKGDEASATVFIPNNWNRQLNVPAFTMSDAYLPDTCVVSERPKAFVLMSDGCESFSWMCMMYDKERNTYYDKNLPFDKFFNPLIEHLDKIADPEERVSELFDIINMGTDGGRREVDDRTMLFGVLAH